MLPVNCRLYVQMAPCGLYGFRGQFGRARVFDVRKICRVVASGPRTSLSSHISCCLGQSPVAATSGSLYLTSSRAQANEIHDPPGCTLALFPTPIARYFVDKWNFLDVTTVMFVLVAFTFRMIELTTGERRHLFVAQLFLASTAPLLSSRVLFLSQIGRALGPMTQVGCG